MSAAAVTLARGGTPLLNAPGIIHVSELAKHLALYPIAEAIAASHFAPAIAHKTNDLASAVFYEWLNSIHPGTPWGNNQIEVSMQKDVECITFAGTDCMGDTFTLPEEYYYSVTRKHPRLLASLFDTVESAANELLIDLITPLAGARAYVNVYLAGDRENFYDEIRTQADDTNVGLRACLHDILGSDRTAPWNVTRSLGAHVLRNAYDSARPARLLSSEECAAAISDLRPKQLRAICMEILTCASKLQEIAARSAPERQRFLRYNGSTTDPNSFPMPIAFVSDPKELTLEFVGDDATQHLEWGHLPSYLDIFAEHLSSPAMIDATSTVVLAQREAFAVITATIADLHALEAPCTR